MSEDSSDKVNNAQPGEEDTTSTLDASGLEPGRVLELSEDSTEELLDAPSGEREETAKPFAGTTEPRLSEDTREVEEPALSSEEPAEPGRDADLSEEAEEVEEEEEELHGHGLDSEDGTSEEPDLSELSQDKDKDALNSPEVTKDSSNANLLEPGEVLESSEDSTEVPTDAPSGERVRLKRLSAGPEELELSEE